MRNSSHQNCLKRKKTCFQVKGNCKYDHQHTLVYHANGLRENYNYAMKIT